MENGKAVPFTIIGLLGDPEGGGDNSDLYIACTAGALLLMDFLLKELLKLLQTFLQLSRCHSLPNHGFEISTSYTTIEFPSFCGQSGQSSTEASAWCEGHEEEQSQLWTRLSEQLRRLSKQLVR